MTKETNEIRQKASEIYALAGIEEDKLKNEGVETIIFKAQAIVQICDQQGKTPVDPSVLYTIKSIAREILDYANTLSRPRTEINVKVTADVDVAIAKLNRLRGKLEEIEELKARVWK
jgi:hypothetical protein